MTTKEGGLRGSIRNVGSVTPAFFQIDITSTNSPVTEGDTLEVDYLVDNTGDKRDIQDVFLEIDSVEEDRDNNIELLGGSNASGTLFWDTTGESATDYTASVFTDDDSDTVTVTVEEPAIPDSVVSRPDDNNDVGLDISFGLAITPSETFDGVGARISNETEGVTRARLYDYSAATYIDSVDISALTAGDEFSFETEIVAGQEYGIEVDAEGSSYRVGTSGATDYPYTGADIDIIARSNAGTQEQQQALGVNDIGNPDGVLD